MISDLPGDIGPLDPAVDELFRTLTSEPTPAELAGEQSAVAMFRANITPPASPATAPIPTRRLAAQPKPSVTRLFRRSPGWGIRLAAAVVIVLAVAMASAAYTAALPQPVQLLAHQVLGFAGVPNPARSAHPGGWNRHPHGAPTSRNSGSSPGQATHGHPAPGGTPSPQAHKSATPGTSPSPPPSAATGRAQLSASASSAEIPAGSEVVIDGQLTRSGAGVQGVTVQLVERLVGHRFWHLGGTGQTTADGNVAITVSAVPANAVFRLRVRGVAHSVNVLVTVIPPITATLTPGAGGLRDVLAVSTQYAHRGNVVQLEVQTGGSWTYLRAKRLNGAGKTTFVISGRRLANHKVRVVLLATARHGASISNTQTVPPPS